MEILVSNLITPAIIITATAFLVRFYGKVISDQKPFADDRNWEIELSGIMFFVNMIIPVASGVFGALKFGWLLPFHFLRSTILVASFLWLFILINVLLEKFYDTKIPFVQYLAKLAKDNELKFGEPNALLILAHRYLITFVLPFLYAYILILEYQSNNTNNFISAAIAVFINSIFIALFYSLKKTRLPQVDLIFVNNERSILDVTLLKVNKDNLRIKQGEKISIINKEQVERIEYLPLKESDKKISL